MGARLSVFARNHIARLFPAKARHLVPESIFEHLYTYGPIRATFNGNTVCWLVSDGHQIENEIFWRGLDGCLEKVSMSLWIGLNKILKPRNVWDIGASTGTYGVVAKAICGDAKVTFFEPLEAPLAILERNLTLNDFDARIFPVALGDFDGHGTVYLPDDTDFVYSVTVNKNLQTDTSVQEQTIPVRRADSLIEEKGLDLPELCKIDVETFEPEVLQGFGVHLSHSTVFLLEVLEADVGTRITSILDLDKYVVVNIDDRRGTARVEDEIRKSDFFNYVIIPITLLTENGSRAHKLRRLLSDVLKHDIELPDIPHNN